MLLLDTYIIATKLFSRFGLWSSIIKHLMTLTKYDLVFTWHNYVALLFPYQWQPSSLVLTQLHSGECLLQPLAASCWTLWLSLRMLWRSFGTSSTERLGLHFTKHCFYLVYILVAININKSQMLPKKTIRTTIARWSAILRTWSAILPAA